MDGWDILVSSHQFCSNQIIWWSVWNCIDRFLCYIFSLSCCAITWIKIDVSTKKDKNIHFMDFKNGCQQNKDNQFYWKSNPRHTTYKSSSLIFVCVVGHKAFANHLGTSASVSWTKEANNLPLIKVKTTVLSYVHCHWLKIWLLTDSKLSEDSCSASFNFSWG